MESYNFASYLSVKPNIANARKYLETSRKTNRCMKEKCMTQK